MFVLSFKIGRNMATRNTFNRHYLPLAEIKDFNVLIDNKVSFVQLVKNKQEACEKPIKMSRNNDCTIGMIIQLAYWYHENCYTLIVTDLSRQKNTSIPQQISFTGKLEENNEATMLFIAEKQEKTILNFSLDLLIVKEQYKQWNIKI